MEEVCEYTDVSSSLTSYLVWELVYVLASCYTKKRRKKLRGVAMVTSLLLTKHCGKYSQCHTFDIKQSPAGRSPEDHQVCAHTYLNVCPEIHS